MKRPKVQPGYESLAAILDAALEHAQRGKGKERHASGEPFLEQPMLSIAELFDSSDGHLYQAVKKLKESKRLPPAQRRAERLGAINYIVGSLLFDEARDQRAVSTVKARRK